LIQKDDFLQKRIKKNPFKAGKENQLWPLRENGLNRLFWEGGFAEIDPFLLKMQKKDQFESSGTA